MPAVAGVGGWRSEEGQVFDTHCSDTVVKISPQRGNWQCCGRAEVSSHGSLVQWDQCRCQPWRTEARPHWGQAGVHHTRTGPGISWCVCLAVRHLTLSPASESRSWEPAETLLGWGSLETALVYVHSKLRVVWGAGEARASTQTLCP